MNQSTPSAQPSDIAKAMDYILTLDRGDTGRLVDSTGLNYLYYEELSDVIDFVASDDCDMSIEPAVTILELKQRHAFPADVLYIKSRYPDEQTPHPTYKQREDEARMLAAHFGCKVACSSIDSREGYCTVAEPGKDVVREFFPNYNPRWIEQEAFRVVEIPLDAIAGIMGPEQLHKATNLPKSTADPTSFLTAAKNGDAAYFKNIADKQADTWLEVRRGRVNLSVGDRLRDRIRWLKEVPGTDVPRARFEREAEFLATPTQMRPKPLAHYLSGRAENQPTKNSEISR